MQFEDSTALLRDAGALRSRFLEDGYVFFRHLLEASKVAAVRADVLAAIEPLGWLAPGSDPKDAMAAREVRREGLGDWFEGYRAIQSVESFHALAHDEGLLAPITALLGTHDVLVHPRKIARVTYPGSEFPTPAHQDFPLIQGSADTFTLWMPLGDCPMSLGGLKVLSGSPLLGLRPTLPREGVGGVGVDLEVAEDDPRWRSIDYESGDVLIIHSFTVHWGPPNRGDRIRLSVDYRYQALGAPVVEGSLLPHGFPAIPSWEELCAGWSTTRWVARPQDPSIVDRRDPFGDLGSPPSLLWPELAR